MAEIPSGHPEETVNGDRAALLEELAASRASLSGSLVRLRGACREATDLRRRMRTLITTRPALVGSVVAGIGFIASRLILPRPRNATPPPKSAARRAGFLWRGAGAGAMLLLKPALTRAALRLAENWLDRHPLFRR